MNILKFIYIALLGIILALFVGLGIETFYPGEKSPDCNSEMSYSVKSSDQLTQAEIDAQKACDKTFSEWQVRDSVHNRNVSIMATIASILLMVLSLTLLMKSETFSNSFLLGSLFVLIYAIIRGMMSDNSQFRFLIVTISLLIAMALGYFKFGHKFDEKK
jgi:VIT1/CCC1 family predicted Fe2+/Mn2+ transporter